MTTIPLLILFSFLPGVWDLEPMDLSIGEGVIAIDSVSGTGESPRPGDLLTLSYQVEDGLGRQIANSDRRGLLYTIAYGEPGGDPLLTTALEGMRAGGERSTWFGREAIGTSAGDLIPPNTEILVRLKLLTVTRRLGR